MRAALEHARRAVPELASLEAELELHEAAIDAHEEMLRRHDLLLAAEARGGPVTSDEMAQFQSEVEERHRRSRDEHRQLEITHRAILQALQGPRSDP